MAIEVKLQFDKSPTPDELMKAYKKAEENAIYEKANETLNNKKNRIIEALNNAIDNNVVLNASLRRQVAKIVNAYEFTEKEIHAEHVRLNPSLRKKRKS